jgi:4-amino-4-deoxy-L-arabinose transferase-like glycosyltransferase
MQQIPLSRLAFLAFIALSVFFVKLGSARLWDRDEPRNSRASHEMLERGDWIVPTFNGELRDHKPILLYWGQMVSYLALGESEFAARLPSALCAILTVIATAILTSRLSGRTTGISSDGYWAAGALSTCLLFVMAGRAATPDACLIAFSTLGIAALVISSLVPSPPFSSGNVGSARWLPAMFGYSMLGLAALAKGPVGVILPLTVVHVWWLIGYRMQTNAKSASTWNHKPGEPTQAVHSTDKPSLSWNAAIGWWLRESWFAFNPLCCLRAVWRLKTIPGLLVCLAVAVPWYWAVGVATDGQFLRGFFLEHNLGRAMGSMEGHRGSLFFYPLAFVVGTFPWSLWLFPTAVWASQALKQNVLQRQLVVLGIVWIAVYISAFSLASTKLPSYITPCYVGAALIAGGFWRQFESAWSRPASGWRLAAYAITIVVGAGISGTILWLSRHQEMPLLAQAAWAGAVISALGILGIMWERRSSTSWVPMTWLVGAAAFQVILFGFGAKSIDTYRSDLALLDQIKVKGQAQGGASDIHWLSLGGLEPSWVHYLGNEITEITSHPASPESWQQVAEFCTVHPDHRVLVVGDEAHQALQTWQSQASPQHSFLPVAAAPRFLRPGYITVIQLQTHIAGSTVSRSANNQPPSTNSIALPSLADLFETPDIRATLPSVPSLEAFPITQLEATLPPADETQLTTTANESPEAINIEVNSMRATTPSRTATAPNYPNPLRPQ